MRFSSLLALLFALAGVPSVAAAHLDLVEPVSRYGRAELKVGPCGRAEGLRSDNVTVFAPGATIQVAWEEYLNHPGHYRIAFDADGDDAFVDPPCTAYCDNPSDPLEPEFSLYTNDAVLLDGIEDGNGGTSVATVTLPNVSCERCTLQVIQVMYDKRPITSGGDDIYYQCADLALRAGANPDGGTTGAPSAMSSCSSSSNTPAGLAPCLVMALAYLRSRRRWTSRSQ